MTLSFSLYILPLSPSPIFILIIVVFTIYLYGTRPGNFSIHNAKFIKKNIYFLFVLSLPISVDSYAPDPAKQSLFLLFTLFRACINYNFLIIHTLIILGTNGTIRVKERDEKKVFASSYTKKTANILYIGAISSD